MCSGQVTIFANLSNTIYLKSVSAHRNWIIELIRVWFHIAMFEWQVLELRLAKFHRCHVISLSLYLPCFLLPTYCYTHPHTTGTHLYMHTHTHIQLLHITNTHNTHTRTHNTNKDIIAPIHTLLHRMYKGSHRCNIPTSQWGWGEVQQVETKLLPTTRVICSVSNRYWITFKFQTSTI